MPPPRLSRKTKQGQDRVLKRTAKKQAEEEAKKNPFQSPNQANRPSKAIKGAKRPRITRKAVNGPENDTEVQNSPKRNRRQLAADLVEPDQLDEEVEDPDQLEDEIEFIEENSLEFVQDLADGLKGDEDPSQYTEDQLDVVVTDEFSGYLMPFRDVLASRKRFSSFSKRNLCFRR